LIEAMLKQALMDWSPGLVVLDNKMRGIKQNYQEQIDGLK